MDRLAVPYVKQRALTYCAPACAEMAAKYYGIKLPQESIVNVINRELPDGDYHERSIVQAMRTFGFSASRIFIPDTQSLETILMSRRPVIAIADSGQGSNHSYVITGLQGNDILVLDPWDARRRRFPYRHFRASWVEAAKGFGIVVGPQKRQR